jgi:hypothetical protein
MKSLYCLVTLGMLTASAFAQPNPDTCWTRTYDGGRSEWATSIQRTHDGGYILAGQSYLVYDHYNTWDAYIVRTDSLGDTLWTRTYGGGGQDYFRGVIETDDGYFVTAGGFDGQFCLMKLTASGDIVWSQTYGSGAGRCVFQTSDHNYVACGALNINAWDWYVIKVTQDTGVTLWAHTYGGSGQEEAYSIRETPDSGLVAAGYTSSIGYGYFDGCLVRMNSNGDSLWGRVYGYGGADAMNSVECIPQGGFMLAGYCSTPGANVYVVRTDDAGDTLRTRQYGGDYEDYGSQIVPTPDGGWAIAGSSNSFGAGYDAYLIKINSEGDTLWTRIYGGPNEDRARALCLTLDDGFALAGDTRDTTGSLDFYVVKTGKDTTLVPPLNLVLRVVGDDVILNWARDNYPLYEVQGAYYINDVFETLGTTSDTTILLPWEGLEAFRFYQVRGILPSVLCR